MSPGLYIQGWAFLDGCVGSSRVLKLVGLLVAVAVAFFILGYFAVSRFIT